MIVYIPQQGAKVDWVLNRHHAATEQRRDHERPIKRLCHAHYVLSKLRSRCRCPYVSFPCAGRVDVDTRKLLPWWGVTL